MVTTRRQSTERRTRSENRTMRQLLSAVPTRKRTPRAPPIESMKEATNKSDSTGRTRSNLTTPSRNQGRHSGPATTDIAWSKVDVERFLSLVSLSDSGELEDLNNLSLHFLHTRGQLLDCYRVLMEKGLLDSDGRRHLDSVDRCLTALNNSRIVKPSSRSLNGVRQPVLLPSSNVDHMANSAGTGNGEFDADAERV
ncbi:hypothetical protein B0H14DRAFT_2567954 [Mycena olivaceomarginata]|nr:hypothetical protein B0H14DRAFT_2567954 [Mycena olivaceomarginata]